MKMLWKVEMVNRNMGCYVITLVISFILGALIGY